MQDVAKKSDREIANAIGFYIQSEGINKLSPLARRFGELLNYPQVTQRICKDIKQRAEETSQYTDQQLLDSFKVSFENPPPKGWRTFNLEKREELIDAIRKELALLKNYNRKELKKTLSLMASGAQLAYEKYGNEASPKNIYLDMQNITGGGIAAYIPTQEFYEAFKVGGPPPPTYDTFIVIPLSLLFANISKQISPFLATPVTAEQALSLFVRAGFEESYHAFQAKNREKREELLNICLKEDPGNLWGTFGGYSLRNGKEVGESKGEKGIGEVDADSAYKTVERQAIQIASAVLSRTK